MATNTLSTILDRLSQRIGDYLSEAVTTAITTNANVICSTLTNYTNRDDFYNRYWLYITDYANAGAYRKVNDYTASSGTSACLGDNFASDGSNKATFQLHKYDRNNKIRAINRAARGVFPDLFRMVRNSTMVSNNILPNSSFEDWSQATYPDYYTPYNASAAKITTAGLTRGVGSTSVKVTANYANGYLDINSNSFPRLLDLMGRSVTLRGWAYPQPEGTADDGKLEIYTLKADGTAQTLTSSTTNPVGKFTKLELENQTLNDDLTLVEVRFKVATANKWVVFDNVRLTGIDINEYVLPLDFQNPQSEVRSASRQVSGLADEECDDTLAAATFEPLWGWDIQDDGTTRFLRTEGLPSERLIQLAGMASLESTLSATTDTMSITDPYLDLLVEYAAYCLFDMEAGLPSAADRDNLRQESMMHLANYNRMKKSMRMSRPRTYQRFDRRIL